jgi:hypothetical protein
VRDPAGRLQDRPGLGADLRRLGELVDSDLERRYERAQAGCAGGERRVLANLREAAADRLNERTRGTAGLVEVSMELAVVNDKLQSRGS